jgi:DNA polymerase III subunit delta'
MSFADFPEQERVVQLLQRSLERGRLAHAYLFSGNDLDELEAVARTLAKTLNCQNPPRKTSKGLPLDSCDQCSSCRRIDGANHPDVSWLRVAARGIEVADYFHRSGS